MPDGVKSPEELLADYTKSIVSGQAAEWRRSLTRPKSKGTFKDTEGSRPPIVVKTGGVQVPRGWFGKGRADKGADRADF